MYPEGGAYLFKALRDVFCPDYGASVEVLAGVRTWSRPDRAPARYGETFFT